MVRIETAGLESRENTNCKPPPEVLSRYGEVKDVQEENWAHAYRYPVANGIRLAMISLAKNIPSHITVAGNRVLVSYDVQPMTCYGCNETGHLYHVCSMLRRVRESVPTAAAAASWAGIAAGGTGKQEVKMKKQSTARKV